METYNDLPLLKAVRVTPNSSYPGSDIVEVYCPECRKNHTHGMPGGREDISNIEPSHRSPHCKQDSAYYAKGYYISY